MAAGERLIFTGVRWAAAYIANVMPLSAETARALAHVGYAPGTPTILSWASPEDFPANSFIIKVTAASSGRPWTASEPMGLWRTFSEVDLAKGDGADALAFTQRHGDPDSQLALGFQIETHTWAALNFGLKQVAIAWDEPDADGVSHATKHKGRRGHAEAALAKFILPDAAALCDVVPDPRYLALAMRANTLRGFMLASAASAFRRGAALRKCSHCGDWFEVRRKDMMFCTPSCRAANAVKGR